MPPISARSAGILLSTASTGQDVAERAGLDHDLETDSAQLALPELPCLAHGDGLAQIGATTETG
jgi:hypothetical protein